jgi:hypothetical protein
MVDVMGNTPGMPGQNGSEKSKSGSNKKFLPPDQW